MAWLSALRRQCELLAWQPRAGHLPIEVELVVSRLGQLSISRFCVRSILSSVM
jgi:hypothetical protein